MQSSGKDGGTARTSSSKTRHVKSPTSSSRLIAAPTFCSLKMSKIIADQDALNFADRVENNEEVPLLQTYLAPAVAPLLIKQAVTSCLGSI